MSSEVITVENEEDKGTESCTEEFELVELGVASKDTQGGFWGSLDNGITLIF